MHSMKIGNYTANFNGDFSGDIIVFQGDGPGFVGTKKVAEIPFMVMLALVGEKLRRERINELEQMEPMDVVYKLLDGDSKQ
jgi:hypothetical protein